MARLCQHYYTQSLAASPHIFFPACITGPAAITLDVLLCRAYSYMTSLPEGPRKVMWQMMAEAALAQRDLEMLALCHEKLGNMDEALQVRQVGSPRAICMASEDLRIPYCFHLHACSMCCRKI